MKRNFFPLKLIFILLCLSSWFTNDAQTISKIYVYNSGCIEINGVYDNQNSNGDRTDVFRHEDQTNSPFEIVNVFNSFWTLREITNGSIGPHVDPKNEPQPSEGTWINSNNITCADNMTNSNSGDALISHTVLPVELVIFRATYSNNEIVNLNWQTAMESDNDGFEIQHSADGEIWQQVTFIEGKGTSFEYTNYSFEHEKPHAGTNYYRLKQIDLDGTFEYSNIEVVRFDNKGELHFYPNPIESIATIKIPEEGLNQSLDFSISDVKGNLIRSFSKWIDETNMSIDLTDLSTGMYILSVNNDQAVWHKKIMKK